MIVNVTKILPAQDTFSGNIHVTLRDAGRRGREDYIFTRLKHTWATPHFLFLSDWPQIYSGHNKRQTIYFTKMMTGVFVTPSTLPSACSYRSSFKRLLPPLLLICRMFRSHLPTTTIITVHHSPSCCGHLPWPLHTIFRTNQPKVQGPVLGQHLSNAGDS